MPSDHPNFLTCPIEPPPPKKADNSKSDVGAHGVRPGPSDPDGGRAPHAPTGKRHIRRWIILALVAIFVAVTAPAAYSLVRAAIAAQSAKTSIVSAQAKLKQLDADGASQDLQNARQSLDVARAALQGVGFWRDMPGIGTQVRGLEDASAAGSGAIDSATDLLAVASDMLGALRGGTEATSALTGIAPTRRFQDLSKQEKHDLLAKFANDLPRLRLARDKMDLALELWNRVPQDRLAGSVRNALVPLAQGLPVLKQALDQVVPLLEVLVPMAGYPEPRRYLMSLQNATELRPAGGFIGTIGTMTWDAGDMTDFGFTDVYTIDNPVAGVWKQTPPEPIQKYLVSNWFLRDANWSPDFPTSADRVIDFYTREVELQLHAPLSNKPTTYLAFEPGFFEALLKLTGPITVNGQTFDSTNFFDKIEYNVEVLFNQQGIPVAQRKVILSKIGDEIKNKVFALPAARWPELLDVVTKSLERKQIMAYSREPNMQALFDSRGWSARTPATQDDFLWVIDANLAAFKTDGAMKKSIRYVLDTTDPQGPLATVTLTYVNTAKGFGDYRYTRYRTYTRVYVPEGSQLLSSNGAMKDDLNKTGGKFVPGKVDVMKELGKTVFGAFWSIEPNHKQELTFTYRLPKSVVDQIGQGSYRLDWLKQAGVDNATLTLGLLFGKTIKSATPSEDSKKFGDARYEYSTDSLMDRTFQISF